MPKSLLNSKVCGCCGRFIPVAKQGKRKHCSPACNRMLSYIERRERRSEERTRRLA